MADPRPGTLEHLAALRPDDPLVVEHGTGRTLTRAQSAERAGRLALALGDRHGVTRGTRVALHLGAPCLELPEILLALAAHGAVPVPVVPAGPAALGAQLAATGASVLISDDAGAADAGGAIVLGDAYEAVLAAAPAGEPPRSGVTTAPVGIAATSGATSPAPRQVQIADAPSERHTLALVVGDLAARAGHAPSGRHLMAGPPWLPPALLTANVALLAGGVLVVVPDGSPEAWLAAVGDHEPRTATVTPALLDAVTRIDPAIRDVSDTTSLHRVLVAGGRLPAAWGERGTDLLGEDVLVALYAAGETGPVAALDATAQGARPGASGLPLAGVDVEIRGEGGEDAPPDGIGVLHVTSPLAAGRGATAGDVGRRGPDGGLVVLGRATDARFAADAGTVFAGELEDALLADEGVAAVLVTATADGAPHVRVEAAGGPVDADALADRLHGALGPVRRVARTVVEPVDRLPRDSLGRVRSSSR